MTDLPEFYFRIRENGAAVYRVSTENRQRRIEMTEIAVVNMKNGNVRPHGEHVLSEAEKRPSRRGWRRGARSCRGATSTTSTAPSTT
jgi:hypothetical protein